MFVIIKTTEGDIKKAFCRNQAFHEADTVNKKLQQVPTSKIASVFWIDDNREMKPWPIKDWLELAEKKNYWGFV